MLKIFFLCAINQIYAMELIKNKTSCKFPNYFSRIQKEKSKEFLNTEISYIVNNLKIPYAENGVLQHDNNFFTKLNKVIQSCCPEAKTYLTGSTLRSILGYVYKKLHNAATKKPEEDLWRYTSKRIRTHKDQTNKDCTLDPLKILNLGEEWEITIHFPPNTEEAIKEKTNNAVLGFVNDLRRSLKLPDTSLQLADLKNTFVPSVKVREYNPQKAKEEGGLSLDRLAFSVDDQRILEPEDEKIFKDFLEGYVNYAGGTLSDQSEYVVSGFRVLLEMPFLHYKKESAERLSDKLGTLEISEEDKKRITDLKLNARFQGANNRFKKKENYDPEDTMFFENIDRLNFPTFLQKKSISLEQGGSSGAISVYHGTPSVKNAIAMCRNGFVCSNNENETSAWKGESKNQNVDGFYTTTSEGDARYYSREGYIIHTIINKENKSLSVIPITKETTHYVITNPEIINKKDIFEDIKEQRKSLFEIKLTPKSELNVYSPEDSDKALSLLKSGVIKLNESQEVDEKILKVIQQLSEEEVDLIIKMRQEKLIPAVYSEGYYCHLIEDLLGFKGLSVDLVGKVKLLNEKKVIDVQEMEWGTQPFSLLKPIDQLDENKIEILVHRQYCILHSHGF